MAEFIENTEIPIPDLTKLRDMTAGDEESFKEVISIFLEDVPQMLVAMKESADSGDHDRLKFVTHKLITQLSYVGIFSAIPDVKLINSGSTKMNDLPERIDRITDIVNYSIDYLKKIVGFL